MCVDRFGVPRSHWEVSGSSEWQASGMRLRIESRMVLFLGSPDLSPDSPVSSVDLLFCSVPLLSVIGCPLPCPKSRWEGQVRAGLRSHDTPGSLHGLIHPYPNLPPPTSFLLARLWWQVLEEPIRFHKEGCAKAASCGPAREPMLLLLGITWLLGLEHIRSTPAVAAAGKPHKRNCCSTAWWLETSHLICREVGHEKLPLGSDGSNLMCRLKE